MKYHINILKKPIFSILSYIKIDILTFILVIFF